MESEFKHMLGSMDHDCLFNLVSQCKHNDFEVLRYELMVMGDSSFSWEFHYGVITGLCMHNSNQSSTKILLSSLYIVYVGV